MPIPYSDWRPPTERIIRALNIISEYAWVEGEEHKQWLLDQVVRVLAGNDYDRWVRSYEAHSAESEMYSAWETGIPPQEVFGMWTAQEWATVIAAVAGGLGMLAKVIHECRGLNLRVRDLADQLDSHDSASTRRMQQHEAASERRAKRLTGRVSGEEAGQ